MTGTVDIGAARVRLIVDANEFDEPIALGRNAIRGFGSDAEQAYNKMAKSGQTAVDRIIQNISRLKRAGSGADAFAGLAASASRMDELIFKASKLGATDSILSALRIEWQKYAQAVTMAGVAQEERQRSIRDEAASAKQAQLQAQITLYNRVEQAARDAAQAEAAQAAINVRTGVGSSTGLVARDQSALIAELQRQVQLEQQIEAEARDINAEVGRWKSQLDAIGKDYYDIQIAQARLRYGAGADPIVKQIEALRQANSTIHGTTVNAKQLQQAIRFLPVQFTDIGVSLASGMNPALVLLQQGGQIFDQFRLAGVGAGGALKEIGVRAMALVNPWTLAAAAVVTFQIAANAVENDVSRLNTALAQTGNYVNQSVGQLQAYIAELNAIPNVSAGTARSAVEAAVGSGRFNGEQFQAVAQAAARMEAEVGQSIDATIRKFEDIAKNPVDALMRLNDAEHFLTQAQIDRIYQLQEEGKQQEAATLAVKLYADALNHVADTAASATPHLTQMWRDIKDAISDAWEWAKGFADFLAGAGMKAWKDGGWTNFIPGGALYNGIKALYTLEPPTPVAPQTPAGPVQDPREVKKTADALADLLAQGDKRATQALALERHEKKLADQLKAGKITYEQYATALNNFEKSQKESASRSSSRRDGPDPTRSIKAWEQAELEALKGVQRETKWAYDDNALTVEAYYNKLNGFAKQERDLAVESAQRQIAALAGRKDASERIEALQENIRQAETAYANKKAENDRAEVLAIRERESSLRDYIKTLADVTAQTKRDGDAEVAKVGMGAVRFQREQAINAALQKRQELLDEIDRKELDKKLSPELAEKYRAALEEVNKQIAQMRDNWQRVDEAQSSFFKGAQGAWETWVEQTRDVASQGADIMTSALEGFTEAAAQALNGNLDQFKSFFENIHMEILRFIVRQQLTKWMESLGKSLSNVEGDGFLATMARGIGGLFGGGKKADTGAAALTASAAALTGSAAALTSAAAALGASGAMSGLGGGGGGGGGWWSRFTSLFSPNAKGGVYGGDGIAAYRNQIVSSPKMFRAYARGGVPNFGLMGERSGKPHEAIMPLTRLPGGDLGVRIVESSKRGPVSINQQFIVQGTPDRTTREQMAKQNGREISRATARM